MSDDKLMQRLKTDLEPRVKELEKDNEAQKPAMQDVINKLSTAIRAMDQPLIKRHAKTLEGQVGAYASLVTRAEKLVAELGAIDTDDRDALKRIVALTEQASASQKKIKGNYEKLKELLSMAHAKATDPVVAAVMAQWAEMVRDPEQKIARPRQIYIGENTRPWTPIEVRPEPKVHEDAVSDTI